MPNNQEESQPQDTKVDGKKVAEAFGMEIGSCIDTMYNDSLPILFLTAYLAVAELHKAVAHNDTSAVLDLTAGVGAYAAVIADRYGALRG